MGPDGMFQAIGEQTVTVPGTLTAERIIPSIARDIKTIKDRRRDLAAQVEKLLEGHPLPTVLTSMPGAGVRTASNIPLGIGGDVTRFKSAAHPAAYAGIAPRHQPVRHQRQRRTPRPRRQQTTQERAAAIRVRRRRQTPRVRRLLQTQTRTGQTPQRRRHPPRPTTLRRHLQHAQKRNPPPRPRPRSLNATTNTPDTASGAKHARKHPIRTPAHQHLQS